MKSFSDAPTNLNPGVQVGVDGTVLDDEPDFDDDEVVKERVVVLELVGEEDELDDEDVEDNELVLIVTTVIPQHKQALLYREVPEQALA